MEGMRHKLSLPGLGMSKCTDPSGAAGCRVPRDTPLQSSEACARSRTAETRRACTSDTRYGGSTLKYCTVRVENK